MCQVWCFTGSEPTECDIEPTWQYMASCMIAYSGFVSKSIQFSTCVSMNIMHQCWLPPVWQPAKNNGSHKKEHKSLQFGDEMDISWSNVLKTAKWTHGLNPTIPCGEMWSLEFSWNQGQALDPMPFQVCKRSNYMSYTPNLAKNYIWLPLV